MRKTLMVSLIVLILILLSGCQNEDLQLQSELTSVQEEVSSLASTIDELALKNTELMSLVAEMENTISELTEEVGEVNRNLAPKAVQEKIAYLTDDEVHGIYRKVVEIFWWFQVSTMNVDQDQAIIIDEQTWFKVVEKVNSYREFIEYMNSVLDYNMVEKLLSSDMYMNLEGDLYGHMADRGTDIYKGEETYEIIRVDEKTVLYRVAVEVLGDDYELVGYETHDFYLKLYTDGRWRFEEFYLFK